MIEETIGWIAALGAAVVLGVAFAVPQTRPYAKKYWWVAVLIAATGIALVLYRRRPGRDPNQDAMDEGRKLFEENMGIIDDIVDKAQEEKLNADIELKARLDMAQEERIAFDNKVLVAKDIEDNVERRKALLRIVGGTK